MAAVPSNIRSSIEASRQSSSDVATAPGFAPPPGPDLPLPSGLFGLLAHRDLSPSSESSFDVLESRVEVLTQPINYVHRVPPKRSWNDHPRFILHPIGRRISINITGDDYGRRVRSIPLAESAYFELKLHPCLSCEVEGFAMRHHSQEHRAPRHWEIWGYSENTITRDVTNVAPPLCEAGTWDGWWLLSKHVWDTTIGVHPNGMGVWLLDAGPHVDSRLGTFPPATKTGTRFTKFRILRTGPSAADQSCIFFHVSGFEIFGKLFIKRDTRS